jgi:hypothetical protein
VTVGTLLLWIVAFDAALALGIYELVQAVTG